MRAEFGYAWGKLYLAILAMATSDAPLPQRVAEAFRAHLGTLSSQNLPHFAYERLKVVRRQLAGQLQDVDDDMTINIAPMTAKQAIAITEEIFSLYDEIARTDALTRAS